jgi:hypothetical protein
MALAFGQDDSGTNPRRARSSPGLWCEVAYVELLVSWDQRFSEPIAVPKGKSLATLRDAGTYISKLPKTEHEATEWQTAVQCLMQAADKAAPVEFAHIGMLRALNRHVERVFDTSGAKHHWGRRKLARDQ